MWLSPPTEVGQGLRAKDVCQPIAGALPIVVVCAV